jgi:hypothetical protein
LRNAPTPPPNNISIEKYLIMFGLATKGQIGDKENQTKQDKFIS